MDLGLTYLLTTVFALKLAANARFTFQNVRLVLRPDSTRATFFARNDFAQYAGGCTLSDSVEFCCFIRFYSEQVELLLTGELFSCETTISYLEPSSPDRADATLRAVGAARLWVRDW